jgi:hypothetical protein
MAKKESSCLVARREKPYKLSESIRSPIIYFRPGITHMSGSG